MTFASLLLAGALAVPGAGTASAQTASSAQGHWEGNIDVPGQPLAISVELSTTASGAWNGAIYDTRAERRRRSRSRTSR